MIGLIFALEIHDILSVTHEAGAESADSDIAVTVGGPPPPVPAHTPGPAVGAAATRYLPGVLARGSAFKFRVTAGGDACGDSWMGTVTSRCDCDRDSGSYCAVTAAAARADRLRRLARRPGTRLRRTAVTVTVRVTVLRQCPSHSQRRAW